MAETTQAAGPGLFRINIEVGDLERGTPGGEPVVRPWGERSFYAEDPWGNPLCFVDDGTIYAG